MSTTRAPDRGAIGVGILGDLVADRDGNRLNVGGVQQRSVIALLVLARGDVVTAERLIDDIWGETPPASATSTLHSYVSRLRSSLAGAGAATRAQVLLRQGPGYRLDVQPGAVDAWRFELALEEPSGEQSDQRVVRLSDALALWRGPALADFAGQPWADAAAARLNGLREVARDQLLAARLEHGEAAVLVPELERLVAEDPLREERWRLLALALYRSSRQADALSALRRARDVLADELGVDPGQPLRQLEADVLAQSPSLDQAPRAAALPKRPAAPSAPPLQSSEPLVDRDGEVDHLAHAIAVAADGHGGVVVLEGPAGIGKTRLLAEARKLALLRGYVVATARGSQLERGYGFGAVRQLLEPFAKGDIGAAAVVFDDELGAGSAADSFSVLNALYGLVAAIATSSPLLLAVDDLQWCDSSSLRFLAFLQRRLDHLPVLIVATFRTGESHDDDDLLAEIAGDPATATLRPAPLSDDAVSDVVRGRLGEQAAPAFLAACKRTTGGNPLLLRQLLRALETDRVLPDAAHADTVTAIGSRAISSMVLLRLRRLPPAATAVARAVAVLGDTASLPAVAALSDLAEGDVVAAVSALSRAEVLRESHPLGFVHPLVADAVYRDLPPGERESAHERAARIIAAGGGSAEQVAAHLLVSPARADQWVVETLCHAADRARHRCALEAATAYLTRAIAEPPSPDEMVGMLVALAQVVGLNNGPLARTSLEKAYDLSTEVVERAEIALFLTSALVFLGPRGAATRFAARAAAELPPELLDLRQALVALGRTAAWIHLLPPKRWLDDEPVTPTGDGEGSRLLAIEQAWELCVRGVERPRAVELVKSALDDHEWLESDHDLFHDLAGIVLMVADEDTDAFWTDALARLHERGEVLGVGIYLWHGVALWRRGELREARQSLLTARHQTEEWGSDQVGVPYCDAFTIVVTLDLGEVEEARARLDEALTRPSIGDGRRLLLEAEAAVLLAERRPAEALVALDRVLDSQAGLANPSWYTARARRAEALSALGRRREASEVLAAEVEHARRWGAKGALGRLLRQLSEVRDDEHAVAAARESVALLEGHPARLQLALALAALGKVVEGSEGEQLLGRALLIANECDAAGLRRDIAAALQHLGVPMAPDDRSRPGLTRLERQCVALVDAGSDVHEVARRLFLTPRTVEAALDSARQRLGVIADAEPATAGH